MVKDKTIFTRIATEASEKELVLGTKEAINWFRKKGRDIKAASPARIMSEKSGSMKTTLVPGEMYFFSYDAKTKAQLPYWDQFPLIFPVEKYNDGFLGINFHYLDRRLRGQLMDALYNVVTDRKFNEKTKLQVSYSILRKMSASKYIKPILKRYLYTQMRSPFIKIDSSEWDIALYLPAQRFVGATEKEVWADSAAIIRGKN